MIKVTGGCRLKGQVEAPPSKSYTHRAAVLASLAGGKSEILKPLESRDTMATFRGCVALGARAKRDGEKWVIEGCEALKTPEDVVNVDNSGTTIRLLTAVSALAPGFTVLTGDESIRRRPMGPLLDALHQLGVECWSTKGDGTPPIVVKGGGVRGGKAFIRGDISSQFISALLIVSPTAEVDTSIFLTSELKSKPYVDITIEVMEAFGVKVERTERAFHTRREKYKPARFHVPGDFSSASFILAAAAITDSDVTVTNLDANSPQGDKKIIDVLRSMGCSVEAGEKWVRVRGGGRLVGVDVDCGDTPDLLPVVSVLGAFAKGETRIFNAEHVRFKESDRISVMAMELSKMGVDVEERSDGLIIKGGKVKGGAVDAHGDHRVFMALVVAGLAAEGETIVSGEKSVDVSYPNFLDDLAEIGASLRRI